MWLATVRIPARPELSFGQRDFVEVLAHQQLIRFSVEQELDAGAVLEIFSAEDARVQAIKAAPGDLGANEKVLGVLEHEEDLFALLERLGQEQADAGRRKVVEKDPSLDHLAGGANLELRGR